MKKFLIFIFVLSVVGCCGTQKVDMNGFVYVPVMTPDYEIATWQKINNPNNDSVHIYIEGDGFSYDAYGQPTNDPTPRSGFVRNLAMDDDFENVVYMARPCQFIMGKNCGESDWTDGRFSQKIINAQSRAIKKFARDKHITLIGYSGGAMLSGLIISQKKDLIIDKWITIAGVLDHKKWTEYFGDEPLSKSVNMDTLPDVPQIHFVGEKDSVVPYQLAKTWMDVKDMKYVKDAEHDDFGDLKIFD